MDFKAALQAEIETKRLQLSKVSATNPNSKLKSTDKITSVKLSDIEKQRQKEYLGKQKFLDEQRKVN